MADPDLLEVLAEPLNEAPAKPPGRYPHTISFRLTDEQMIAAQALAQTFPRGSFSEAFQWFLSSGPGRALIAQRVRGEI